MPIQSQIDIAEFVSLHINGMPESPFNSLGSIEGFLPVKERRKAIKDSQIKALRAWYKDDSSGKQSLETYRH